MKLHDYQKRAIDFCLTNKIAYLAIDLGMGKTAIALKVIETLKIKALVIAPVRVCYTSWPEEIKKWTPQLRYRILHGPTKTLIGADRYDILLINYEGLKWLSKQKGKFTRRLVIFDEASMVKAHDTLRFELLKKMQPFFTDYRLALSATPSPNGLHELWAQYYLLDRGKRLGKNITAFRNKYCTSFSYPDMPITVYKVDPRFEKEVYEAIAPITFRLAAEDYLKLPEITYNEIKLEMPTSLYKKYKELETEFFIELETANVVAFSATSLSMKLRQFIQGFLYIDDKGNFEKINQVKLNTLKELMDTAAGNPILCAIQFKAELAMIKELYPNTPVIAGGTPTKDSIKYINKWNEGKIPLLLCHPASLGHGVNLQTGGHIVLWYGLPWSLEHYLQLNGRLFRQGQQKHVIVHHLIMNKTIDLAVIKALKNKAASMTALLKYLRDYKRNSNA